MYLVRLGPFTPAMSIVRRTDVNASSIGHGGVPRPVEPVER